MQSLDFNKRFVDLIESGEKKQTIRPNIKDIKVGHTVTLTNDEDVLGEVTVKRICPVKITHIYMDLDGEPLIFPLLLSSIVDRDQPYPTDEEFARAEGFSCFMEMSSWIDSHYGLPFEGVVIYWDEIIPQAQVSQDEHERVIGASPMRHKF